MGIIRGNCLSFVGMFMAWVSIVGSSAICIAVWYGGRLLQANTISVGQLTSFFVYTKQINNALTLVSGLFGDLMQVYLLGGAVIECSPRMLKVAS